MTAETPRKKSAILKWTLRIFLGLIVLLLIAFCLYYFMIDGYIRGKVIEAAKNATGQETKLELADLRAFSGKLTLTKFNLANPKDFSAGGLCDFSNCTILVNTGSLMSDTVVIDEVVISDLVVSIEEKNLRFNLMEVINYIQGQRGQETAGQQAAPSASANPSAGKSKDLKITVLRITKPKLKIDLLGVKQTYDLEDIEFKEPLNPDGRYPKVVDIFGKVLLQIAKQAFSNPKLGLPKNVDDLLKGNLGKLDGIITKDTFKDGLKIGNIFKDKNLPIPDLSALGKDLQKNLDNIGVPADVKDAGKDIQKGIQDLLGGNKDKK